MEENFATYILEEKDWARKMEIMFYLEKKGKVFFDKSVIFKTALAKLFMDVMNIEDIDQDIVITACLLCNCKKPSDFTEISKVKSFAKDGADYLNKLGFAKRFCKICEEVNRYSGSSPRETESDILELVDIFGGMLLDRFDRMPFKPDEALLLLEYRNLKGKNNKYLKDFIKFVDEIQRVHIKLYRSIEYLAKLINTSKTTKVALVNAYNAVEDIEDSYYEMKNKEAKPKVEEVVEIKINPDDIEPIILKRKKDKDEE